MTQTKKSNRSVNQRSTSRKPSSGSRNSSYGGPRTQSGNPVRKNRKKKPPFDFAKVLIGIVAVIIIAVCVVLVSKGFGKEKPKETEETTVQETELQKEVTVNGVVITGMSREAAKSAILKSIDWNIKVKFKEEEHELPNFLEGSIEEILDEIYQGEAKDAYNLNVSGIEEAVAAEVAALAKKWDAPAKNACISGFDPQTDKFIFSDEKNGEVILQEQLVSEIMSQCKSGSYKGVLTAASKTESAEITREMVRDLYQVIGTYTTTTTSNKDRNTNVSLSAKSFHGMIIEPGAEFSFNETTGNRTIERGYKPAGAYVNGVLVEEPGGGVCQVSSTLYNAVVFAGLKTTERHAHSYEPSYVTPGEDAMVSYDGYAGPDMKFVNNSKDSIGIKTSFSNQKLTISIYGIRILEEGTAISMSSKKVSVLDPPAPVYEEDITLELDKEVIAKAATPGSRWTTNIITKKNGETVSEEFFHNSTYRGKPATIKRNTSGTVVTPTADAASTESPGESTAADSTNNLPQAPGTTPTQPSEQEPAGPGNTTPAPTQPPATTAPATQPPVQAPTQEPSSADSTGTIISPNPMS